MTCVSTYQYTHNIYYTYNIFIYMKTIMCVVHKIESISTQLSVNIFAAISHAG